MASAYAAGLAALLFERAPTAKVVGLTEVMSSTAKDLGKKGPDSNYGAGRLDAAAAISALGAVVRN